MQTELETVVETGGNWVEIGAKAVGKTGYHTILTMALCNDSGGPRCTILFTTIIE